MGLGPNLLPVAVEVNKNVKFSCEVEVHRNFLNGTKFTDN